MEQTRLLEAALATLKSLDVPVEEARLGGNGGGLCQLRGKRIVVVDLDADLPTQLNRCLTALGSLPEAETAFMIPALREALEQCRSTSP